MCEICCYRKGFIIIAETIDKGKLPMEVRLIGAVMPQYPAPLPGNLDH